MSKDSIHGGHRERMRKKYIDNGMDIFETHEALEMLLYYAVPRKNTSDLAHRLLDSFGSISAVLDSPIDALISFGLTQSQAVFIKMIPDFARLYYDDRYNNSNKAIDPCNVGEHLARKFIGRVNEVVYLLLLDAKNKEVFCGLVATGSISDSAVPVRKIVDYALRYNAKTAYIAHNHPSGYALPTVEDLDSTRAVYSALALVGVELKDHFIVADDDFVSLAQCKTSIELFGE